MKRILIISYSYAPKNVIGAVRPTKLAKFLNKNGNVVDIVKVSDFQSSNFKYKYENEVYSIEHSKLYLLLKSTLKKTRPRKSIINIENTNTQINSNRNKTGLKVFIGYLLKIIQSYDYYYKFKNHYKKYSCNFKKYDIVISTYSPMGSHLCGKYLKKKLKNIIWIADFRDPMVTRFTPFGLKEYFRIKQDKFCKKADYITAVSEGYLYRIIKPKYLYKSKVITNAFDLDDKPLNLYDYLKFSFTYVGSLYGGARDISALFASLRTLVSSNYIDENDIEINYAGNDFLALLKQAEKYNLERTLKNHGFLNRERVLELQSKSRYLLLGTWNSEDEIGVIPGKFFEYLIFDKPIIAIINGNKMNSEISKIIKDGNFGFCYEEANYEKDFVLLLEYIKRGYLKFRSRTTDYYKPNKEILDSFNFINTFKNFEELFNNNNNK